MNEQRAFPYTVGGLLAALKPAGMVFGWQGRAYAIVEDGKYVWYDTPYRLHKTDFIGKLQKLDPASPSMPYYVTNHEYQRGSITAIARNVYVGSEPGINRPNVVQDGDR